MFLLYRINKPRMEELMPPFLSTSHCQFYGTCLCACAQQTIGFTDLLVTREFVPSLFVESITRSSSKSVQPVFRYSLTNSFLSPKIFMRQLYFSFISHIFRGLAGTCVNPGSYIFKLSFCSVCHFMDLSKFVSAQQSERFVKSINCFQNLSVE